jgi:murein L,D-transpeptidase YcbB/YkuD
LKISKSVIGLLLLVGAAGCDPQRKETLKTDEISEWLKRLPEDGVVQLASGDTVHVSPATMSFYKRRLWRAAWAGEKELLQRGWQLHQTIGKAYEDGLPRERYRNDAVQRMMEKLSLNGDAQVPDSLRPGYLASVDLLLTEGFNRYANDLVTGILDPKESGIQWRIPRGRPLEERVLNAVIRGTEPAAVVAKLRPAVPYYDRMRQALVQYHQVASRGGWQKVPGEVKLKAGVRHNNVSLLRTRLLAGLDTKEASLAQTGAADPTLFDANLKQALAHFQERHGIEHDGAVGEATLRELNHSVEQRIEELQLNMDRWRWLPESLGSRYLIVNIAGFELEVVDQNRVIESMNVVVGQPSWQTPVFMDTMEHIVVNPYWNVPPNIYNQEIAPAIAADPTYLARHNYERTRDGGVRQRPGPGNALGNFKFIFPNSHDVYLHDTPADHLFSRTRRDFSHGCIRLERPADLARLIARLQTSRNPEDVVGMAGGGSERWIKLEKKLPVYILYFTVWPEEDGTLRFHHDVYGRDEKMETQQSDKLVGRVTMR